MAATWCQTAETSDHVYMTMSTCLLCTAPKVPSFSPGAPISDRLEADWRGGAVEAWHNRIGPV